MGVSGMQWNVLIIITHTLIGPISCVVTVGQLTGQLNLFMVRLHHNIIKGPSLSDNIPDFDQ